jgi:carbon-monoxide dehydrogenase large subunit
MNKIGTYVGSRQPRNEDRRHLRGEGQFLADLRFTGMRDLAFVRSDYAHGYLRAVEPPATLADGDFWSAEKFESLALPIVADSPHPNFQSSAYTLLAKDKVRFVGEPIAVVIGDDRAEAEDIADQVLVTVDSLPAVVDAHEALTPGSPLVHEHWSDNRFMHFSSDFGDVDGAAKHAAVSVTREYTMARHPGVPLETRGCVAYYDHRLDQLVLYSSTQFPHVIRTELAKLLGIEERRLRVIAPDVGGGFGIKNNLHPEEVVVAAIAMQVGHPVRWIEDRWEHMVASPHARDHHYRITAYASEEGDLLAVDADILVDAGAYSVWPWTASMEAGMSAGIIPGPYRLRNYRVTAVTVATNKSPMGPYRGVARPGACFAIERTVDELALQLGMEPKDFRMRNMVRPEEFPYTSVTGKVYDSGNYAESVELASKLIDHDAVRARQAAFKDRDDRRLLIGLGYASFTEQTAHGPAEWASRGLPIVFGFESARVTVDPSGSATISVGIQSHGQGLETSLAQVAADVLGLDPASIAVRHGDTDLSPYGMGTFASRSMVMAGGATHLAAEKVATKVRSIAAGLLECSPQDLVLTGGRVVAPTGSVSLAEVAKVAYLHVERLPKDIVPCLDETAIYRPEVESGFFSYATHAAVVEVDTDTGHVRLLDYAVAEDCGRIVNPLIVDGQIHGGVAQGIGTALYEELPYDEQGQPKATTFLDYILPGATEIPNMRIGHLETLSPHTVLGIKGMGEGGAIAPPAAIANAITDALRPLGVAINFTPMTPRRVWLAIDAAEGRSEP